MPPGSSPGVLRGGACHGVPAILEAGGFGPEGLSAATLRPRTRAPWEGPAP